MFLGNTQKILALIYEAESSRPFTKSAITDFFNSFVLFPKIFWLGDSAQELKLRFFSNFSRIFSFSKFPVFKLFSNF